jgi:uncharacterized membrane protein YhhN
MILAYGFSLAWGIAYGVLLLDGPPSHLRAMAKAFAVGLMAVLAYVAGLPHLLAIALLLSAIGDWFLAFDGEQPFMAGLVSFLLAHLCYCWLFFGGQDPAWSGSLPFFAGTVLIFAVTLGLYRILQRSLGAMRLPVALYTGVLSAMATAALSRGPDPVLIAGVVLLLSSDAVLAFEKFRFAGDSPSRKWSGPFVWFAYLFGQALVLGAFLFR